MSAIAVIGLGRMGTAMARKLVDAGHDVHVWNRSRQAADALCSDVHATPFVSAAEAVVGVDVVICVLADGKATRSTLVADPLFMEALDPSSITCDMSTSGVESAQTLAREFKAHDRVFIDAPVSGSVATVAAGGLLVMASGARDAVDRASPAFGAFSKRVVYLGAAGQGQAMKLAVNLVVFALNSAVAEALALAEKAGIATSDAYEVLENSAVAAPLVHYKKASFLDPATPVGMSLDLVQKDLVLALSLGQERRALTPLTEALLHEVSAACGDGFGTQDMAELLQFLAGRRPGVK